MTSNLTDDLFYWQFECDNIRCMKILFGYQFMLIFLRNLNLCAIGDAVFFHAMIYITYICMHALNTY